MLLGFGAPLPEGVSLGTEVDRTTTIFITDGGLVSLGLAQVGVGVTAHIHDEPVTHRGRERQPSRGRGRRRCHCEWKVSNEVWQWQRSAAEQGVYSDIPAAEGGTSNPYIPSAGDLGMWLKAKVTYDRYDPDDRDDDAEDDPDNDITVTGRTAEAITQQPVLAKAVVSNAGFSHFHDEGFTTPIDPWTHRYAQAFTTGPDPRGYLLLGVRLALYEADGKPRGTWAVYADDAGKPAAAPLSAVVPIPSIDNREDTFEELTDPRGTLLQPGAKYWIVISQTTPSEDGNFGVSAWNRRAGSLMS